MRKFSQFLNLIIITLISVIGGGIYYLKLPTEPIDSKPVLSQQELDDIVNAHIKKTARDVQQTKNLTEKSAIETRKMLEELWRLKKAQDDKKIADIPLDRQIWKNDQTQPPLDIVFEENNNPNQMSDEEKKEYAREWKRNALKEGYLLELTPELEIIRYTPIRKPSQLEDSNESYPSD